jgi:hypothetical protein
VGTRIVVDERAVGDERRDVEDLGIVVAILSEGSARCRWSRVWVASAAKAYHASKNAPGML